MADVFPGEIVTFSPGQGGADGLDDGERLRVLEAYASFRGERRDFGGATHATLLVERTNQTLHDVSMNRLTPIESNLQGFWTRLERHDWSARFSDDPRVTRRAEEDMRTISRLARAGGAEYENLLVEYAAYAAPGGTGRKPDPPMIGA